MGNRVAVMKRKHTMSNSRNRGGVRAERSRKAQRGRSLLRPGHRGLIAGLLLAIFLGTALLVWGLLVWFDPPDSAPNIPASRSAGMAAVVSEQPATGNTPGRQSVQAAHSDGLPVVSNAGEISATQNLPGEKVLQVETAAGLPGVPATAETGLPGCLGADFPASDTIDDTQDFVRWLAAYKRDAQANGISEHTISAAFRNIRPIQKVIELDRRQSEYTLTFSRYLDNNISRQRISRGRAMLKKYSKVLRKVGEKYGVQPRFLVALWAMESNFGQNTGGFSTIAALTTLAFEGRRREFFTRELLCALQILDEGHITVGQMKGSWAGAMGQPQFIPSTFVQYAVDGDGDGRYDIWKNPADVFASAANYLSSIGWDRDYTWGREVRLSREFDPYLARYSEQKLIEQWHRLGVTKARGGVLPTQIKIKGSIILPSGIAGPAFLVYQNFRVLREWNRSLNYALVVGHLSDRLRQDDPGPLKVKGPKDESSMSRQEVIKMQQALSEQGWYNDKIDGMAGLKTREAIREFQKHLRLPADAYPSAATLKFLWSAVDEQQPGNGDARSPLSQP